MHATVALLLAASARAVDYLTGNPRAAARAKAVALVDAIGGASALPDPDVLRTTALDWSAIDEGLLPATRERDDEQRKLGRGRSEQRRCHSWPRWCLDCLCGEW